MSYKPEQGRIARMVAFWLLFVLVVYGWFSLKIFLDNTLPVAMTESFGKLPVIKEVTPNAILAYLVLPALTAFGLVRILNKPKVADFLIETESELRKVHWPTFKETRTASIVVMTTVVIMGAYLFSADKLLGRVIAGLLSLGN